MNTRNITPNTSNIMPNTSKSTMTTKTLLAAAFAGAISLFSMLPAAAQSVPSYASAHTDETIQGTIASVDGPYAISVRDSRGFVDSVTLHQGTIINPTGLTLAAGQSVTILGQNAGSTFSANQIDTPYTNLALVPVYPGYYGYPYRGFGYGPTYSLGLRFGRGFGFGFRG
jgi:hypothetical protein